MKKKIKLYEFTANMLSKFFTNCKGEVAYGFIRILIYNCNNDTSFKKPLFSVYDFCP